MAPEEGSWPDGDKGCARFWEKQLDDLLTRDPEHFRALRAIVEGRPGEASQRQRHDLKEWSFLSADGSPRAKVKTVLLAIVRDSLDGILLVDPFDVRNAEDVEAIQRADDRLAEFERRNRERLLRGDFDQEKDEGKGRSR